MSTLARSRSHPLVLGVALGIVMLVSFALAGRGIGASGAFAVTGGRLLGVAGVAPSAESSPALADRIPGDVNPWDDWLVIELIGVFVGGALASRVGLRRKGVIDRGSTQRLRPFIGGALMGIGARLAWGCTSGLALTGGALLATGAWLFIPLAFGTAILVTLAARKGGRHA